MHAMQKAGVGGEFVIVASDGLGIGFDSTGIESVCAGALMIQPYTVQDMGYREFYQGLTMADNKDPWLKLAWSTLFKCAWNSSDSGKEECKTDVPIKGTVLDSETFITPLMIDGVQAISRALKTFIKDACPQAFIEKDLLEPCLRKRELLLPYLYKVKYTSTSGDVLGFDKEGKVCKTNREYMLALKHSSILVRGLEQK